jgi:putative transposase
MVLSEPHLRLLVQDYIRYYHEDRVHAALNKETPAGRVLEPRPTDAARVLGMPRVGGLHHRYQWQSRLKARAPP